MKTVLAVLSGGCPQGLDIHSGNMRAMKECGIVPTYWSGNSAGSFISSWCASGNDPAKAGDLISGLTDADFQDYRNFWLIRESCIGSMMSNGKIIGLLQKYLPDFIPSNLSLWATRCDNRAIVDVCRHGLTSSLRKAVLTSMAIHGIWPTITLNDGNDYADGGYRFNLPYDPHLFPVFDEVWMFVASGRPPTYSKTNLLTIAREDISWLIEGTMLKIIEECAGDPKVRVIWPNVAGDKGDLEFDHSLIEPAYIEAKAQILAYQNTPHQELKRMLVASRR